MYKLRCTIKCPKRIISQLIELLDKLHITDYDVREVSYDTFINESRMYWDYVFPEMSEEKNPVYYLIFYFSDTPEGRKMCHEAEKTIGWIPLNIRYVEV